MAGIVLAALTEAIASSVLAIGRSDMLGDTHATPDEFAWLDIGYTACKLMGFLIAPWLMTRLAPRSVVIAATLLMGLACAASALTADVDLLAALRAYQGMAGGILLVAGQALVFLTCPRAQQPALQAVFAMGAVVAPTALAPALQGWLIDSQSWTWIFLCVVPLALAAAGLLLAIGPLVSDGPGRRPFDGLGCLVCATALGCLTYALSQGSRWDWFEEPAIAWSCVIGGAALLLFIGQQLLGKGPGLLDFTLFRSSDFTFALIVSFVAGAALFGSAFVIPAFALSVLAFTPTDAGLLLLPSGAVFIGVLLLVAYLIQVRGVAPFATVPFGILMIMVAMWMLSGSTGESGKDDMMAAVLLRGAGLGMLFLSLTLIAFGKLDRHNLASGIGLFNTGRQLGGLMGVAGLQTLLDRHGVLNTQVLGWQVSPASPALVERLDSITAMLRLEGLDATTAARMATSLLGRTVSGQGAVIAFDTAFNAVALLFAVAAPLLVGIKLLLARRSNRALP
ncbi:MULTISPECIES: MFS transporter [unclassified Pseudomonas]|uniref:MFS transporter n=1 Tax=unclassified Pseudomonas TaxID=196821 RepID=UPI00244CBB46|nr:MULTISPECIES: MFS transporter [unclassified Pseudomonas]MDH0301785.1 MFS transporter [Pseudomonas sp. GD04091]MDH1983927.1 MFS transporter [Pseudomonas sp. GD03689]